MTKIGTVKVDKQKHQVIIDYVPDSQQKTSSGKNLLLATTGGFLWVDDIGVSVNVIKK